MPPTTPGVIDRRESRPRRSKDEYQSRTGRRGLLLRSVADPADRCWRSRPGPTTPRAWPSSRRRSARRWPSTATAATRPGPPRPKGGLRLDSRDGARKGGALRPGRRPRQAGREPAPGRDRAGRRRGADAARRPSCPRRSWTTSADGSSWGRPTPARPRRPPPRPGGRSGRSPGPPSPTAGPGPGSPIDAFLLAKMREQGLDALARGRPPDPDPPRHVRPDRPAADARGGRGVPGRPRPRRLRAARRPPPGQPPSTASAGGGTGSTWPATATPTATTRTSPGPTPGPIATT